MSQTIFDPYYFSGLAERNINRQFIGIKADPERSEVAATRIANINNKRLDRCNTYKNA